jgi:hypothetical protein
MKHNCLLLILFALPPFTALAAQPHEFVATDHGARPDDAVLDTAGMPQAIDACAAAGGGTVNNIATFRDAIRQGDFRNPTVAESVRSNLTTILGRSAAYQGTPVTGAEMMQAKEKWTFDLKGLKA